MVTWQVYSLTLTQSTPPTPGQPEKAPFHIPIETALILPDGSLHKPPTVLELKTLASEFVFEEVPAAPTPSLLRGFSSPVRLEISRDDDELAFLAANDDDPFSKWDASQRLATR